MKNVVPEMQVSSAKKPRYRRMIDWPIPAEVEAHVLSAGTNETSGGGW